jgi:hypothetical protein
MREDTFQRTLQSFLEPRNCGGLRNLSLASFACCATRVSILRFFVACEVGQGGNVNVAAGLII